MREPLSSILAQLKALEPELRDQFGFSDVGVFGSFARGEEAPGSDLDLLLDFLSGARPTYFSLAYLEQRLTEALGLPVETVPRESPNPRLAPYIDAELFRA